MKICSFFGQRNVYDQRLKTKIVKKLNIIMSCDNSFIFYFYLKNDFSFICFNAVQQIKNKYVDKEIKIIYVSSHNDIIENIYSDSPSAIMSRLENYDDFLIPPVIKENILWYHNCLYIQKWIIEQSDFVFFYLYNNYSIMSMNLLTFLKKQVKNEKLTLFDITYKNTKAKINDIILSLPEDRQYIYKMLNAGIPVTKLSKELGISSANLYRMYSNVISSLSELEQNK